MVGIKALIFYFLALFVASNAARAETAHSVLQRYSAWRGGEAFKRLNEMSEAGSFSDGGLSGQASRYASSQGEVYADSQFGPFKTVLSVRHDKRGYTDLARQRLPLASLEILYARIDAGLLLAAPTESDPAIVLRQSESFGGKSSAVVEVDRVVGGLLRLPDRPRNRGALGRTYSPQR